MLFDMHIHSQEYSDDSAVSINGILKAAKDIGLSGVCITDHNSTGFSAQAEELSRKVGIEIIVGMEYSCVEGHLLIFGVPFMAPGKTLLNALLEVKKFDGIVIAAHPFRWDSPLMGDAIAPFAQMLDGVEAFNGSATSEENLRAHSFAVENNLLKFGGSDAHHVSRVGRFATDIVGSIHSDDDFVRAIQKAKGNKKADEIVFPVARKGSTFASALLNEKQYRNKYAPPPVSSLKQIIKKIT